MHLQMRKGIKIPLKESHALILSYSFHEGCLNLSDREKIDSLLFWFSKSKPDMDHESTCGCRFIRNKGFVFVHFRQLDIMDISFKGI